MDFRSSVFMIGFLHSLTVADFGGKMTLSCRVSTGCSRESLRSGFCCLWLTAEDMISKLSQVLNTLFGLPAVSA